MSTYFCRKVMNNFRKKQVNVKKTPANPTFAYFRPTFCRKICRVFGGKFGGMAEKCYLCSAKSLEKIHPLHKKSLEKIHPFSKNSLEKIHKIV